MAKLTFPSVARPYISSLSAVRTVLLSWARLVDLSPSLAAPLREQIATLMTYIGGSAAGSSITILDAAGTTDTSTIQKNGAGLVTSVTHPGTSKVVKSTVKFLAPATTGSYVNGYTLTIANGVVTAIVAS